MTTASHLIQTAATTLDDLSGVYWTTDELVRHLNDGQRDVLTYRPDALTVHAALTLAAGALQSLPAGASKLVDIERNTSGRMVTQVSRALLDAQVPTWYTMTPSATIEHYSYDPRRPGVFFVYPPATTAASLDVVYVGSPTDIAEPGSGATYADVVGTVSLPAQYDNALVDYILYRAYSKQSESAEHAGRAVAHYQAYASSLGIEAKGTVAIAPQNKQALSAQ